MSSRPEVRVHPSLQGTMPSHSHSRTVGAHRTRPSMGHMHFLGMGGPSPSPVRQEAPSVPQFLPTVPVQSQQSERKAPFQPSWMTPAGTTSGASPSHAPRPHVQLPPSTLSALSELMSPPPEGPRSFLPDMTYMRTVSAPMDARPQFHRVSESVECVNDTEDEDGDDSAASQVVDVKILENRSDLTLQDVSNESVFTALAMRQKGSRLLQALLDEASPREIERIIDSLSEHQVRQVSCDMFGNHVVQRLVQTDECAVKVLAKIGATKTLTLMRHACGCRVLQHLLRHEHVQPTIVEVMKGRVPTLVSHRHAHHVVQQALRLCSMPLVAFVCDELFVKGDTHSWCTHDFGCRVVQRVVERHADWKETGARLISQLVALAPSLASDAFGNYVLQHLLQQGTAFADRVAKALLRADAGVLCRDRHASNVAEQCLIRCSSGTRSAMIEKLVQADLLKSLIVDRYGNYVLQRVLKVSPDQERKRFLCAVAAHASSSLLSQRFARHFASAVLQETGLPLSAYKPRERIERQKAGTPRNISRSKTRSIQSVQPAQQTPGSSQTSRTSQSAQQEHSDSGAASKSPGPEQPKKRKRRRRRRPKQQKD
ncbi:MAG: hypothetical protein MHM6MM_002001 [Cercozoa sp. M6MM]